MTDTQKRIDKVLGLEDMLKYHEESRLRIRLKPSEYYDNKDLVKHADTLFDCFDIIKHLQAQLVERDKLFLEMSEFLGKLIERSDVVWRGNRSEKCQEDYEQAVKLKAALTKTELRMTRDEIMKAAEEDSVLDIIYKVPRCLDRPNNYGNGFRAVTIKFLHSTGEWRIFISGYAPMYDKELKNLMRRYAQHIKENLSKGK